MNISILSHWICLLTKWETSSVRVPIFLYVAHTWNDSSVNLHLSRTCVFKLISEPQLITTEGPSECLCPCALFTLLNIPLNCTTYLSSAAPADRQITPYVQWKCFPYCFPGIGRITSKSFCNNAFVFRTTVIYPWLWYSLSVCELVLLIYL